MKPDNLSAQPSSEATSAPLIGIARHRLTIDGEGVTTLVAFHGCTLRCRYCLNAICLRKDGIWKTTTPSLLYEELRCDELYFLATGGGVTFGGGEPMLQSRFISEFRQLCGKEWRLTLETSLNVPRRLVEELIPVADNYIIDIKDMRPDVYRAYTGRSNRRVIANLRLLLGQVDPDRIIVRTPLIPSYNTEQDLLASAQALRDMGVIHLNPFTYRTPNDE